MWVPMNDDLELELQCGSSSGDMLLWKPWSWKFLHASERLSIRSMHLGSLMKTDTCHFSSGHLTYTFKIWPWKEKPAVKLSCLREFSCVALTGQIFFFLSLYIKGKKWGPPVLSRNTNRRTTYGGSFQAVGREPQAYNPYLLYSEGGWLSLSYSPLSNWVPRAFGIVNSHWLTDRYFSFNGAAHKRDLH